ncbi:MAG: hypothetical protein PHQ26_00595 [Bacteroidales bacterium]|nr:hypothetical protein [Bacteroidales bacterium]MDD3166983.1 hypothetical protein [Bacteroidales bacterium]MDD4769962.1 hypothetical protein [Bacteroidales bacterium]
MKAKWIFIGIAAFTLSAYTSAQTENTVSTQTSKRSSTYVDANKDGVCDNLNAEGQGLRQGNRDGKGKNATANKGQGLRQGNRDGKGNQAGLRKRDGSCRK